MELSAQPFAIMIEGVRPFAVTRKDLKRLLPAEKLVQRLIYWSIHAPNTSERWLEVVRAGAPGREALYTTVSAERAFERMRQGEMPPLLPSEKADA